MSKIGVLTFHNNENRGAILQAYSLCEVLDEVFSADVEVIEYRTKAKEHSRRNPIFLTKRPWRSVVRFKDRRIVEEFIDTKLPTSSESIITDNHGRAVDWLENQGYDMVITGSDEIWKINTDLGGDFLPRLSPTRPFPNLYFLDPDLSSIKVAYAASANQTNPSDLSESKLSQVKTHLYSYDHVSVRDNHTEELVTKLGISSVYRVPDPTLMTELPTSNVRDIFEENGINLDDPILGVHSHNDNPTFKEICSYYRDKGFQIVTPTSSKFVDLELIGKVDPFEYYSTYEHYDMVITSSLHSTIFSLKHGTPFTTVDVSSIYDNMESKTHSLLEEFSLLNRHINAVNGDLSEFYARVDDLERKPDETHINRRVSGLREQGFDFLNMVKEDYETND
ncbi:hypothetical protein Natpe_3924 (plasmid) [Natrinema pellirubrum DSM 15624]|uniref:Polysaccharide pyruvyl transferase domain-containing protein n=1 Tax=Natrinema pellirubrum (strain DSM 15624 / CIP 106293 / JCM 10476 / NCIMB 786 / 157) TaxID=797303 RepID=L0JSP7_NATP1|nr:polysaccharide pyruvyl transferase family protein [Natrinema pellirubrum]AGB33677.1 hypothetical protein Natpe_3924 [Natrinema pellirubrum DSM 15624]